MSRLVMASKASPTMVGGQTYIDFSAHGQSILSAVAYCDGSGNSTAEGGLSQKNKFVHDVSNLIGQSGMGNTNIVYVSVFTSWDVSSSGWKDATTADLAGKRVVVIADIE